MEMRNLAKKYANTLESSQSNSSPLFKEGSGIFETLFIKFQGGNFITCKKSYVTVMSGFSVW